MTEEKPKDHSLTKAPLIILGTMLLMSIVTVTAVLVTHYKRTEPYLDSKLRRVEYKTRAPKHTLSLNYVSFGPQALSHELIGKQWWQWQAHGSDDPSIQYDIKIVVYKDMSEKQVSAKFPIIESKFMDYRYLPYADAIAYLDKNIAELEDESIRTTLTSTRSQLASHFR